MTVSDDCKPGTARQTGADPEGVPSTVPVEHHTVSVNEVPALLASVYGNAATSAAGPYERVVMLIAYGYADPAALVPLSAKRLVEDIRTYRTL